MSEAKENTFCILIKKHEDESNTFLSKSATVKNCEIVEKREGKKIKKKTMKKLQ